jgi:benzoyl-CoA reductase subunit C
VSDLTALLDRAEALLHDAELRQSAVLAWKRRHPGRRAVGYLPVYAPVEIVRAAGALPVALFGGGDQVEIIRGDAYFQSYLCQIPRSTIELALAGKLDALDGFLFPSTCDVIRNLSGMFAMLMPARFVRYLDVPQNFDPAVGGRWWRGELRRLWHELCELGDRPVEDAALREAIRVYDENRALLRELYDLRASEPWRVPTSEAYLVVRAGDVLDVEEHNDFVARYLAAVRDAERPRRDNARVLLVGCFCEQPPLGLLRTLERAGCYVVDDELVLGRRFLLRDVGAEADPIEALADALIQDGMPSASRWIADAEKGQSLVQLGRRRRAEGVLFGAPSFCDPALLDQPMLEAALDRAGIPHTSFKYAENLGQFQVIREQAGTFADAIKLWSEP